MLINNKLYRKMMIASNELMNPNAFCEEYLAGEMGERGYRAKCIRLLAAVCHIKESTIDNYWWDKNSQSFSCKEDKQAILKKEHIIRQISKHSDKISEILSGVAF